MLDRNFSTIMSIAFFLSSAGMATFPADFQTQALNGANGFETWVGGLIGAGDINDDGVADIILPKPNITPFTENEIQSSMVVLFGKKQTDFAQIYKPALDGTNGFLFSDATTKMIVGLAVGIGDFNHDGIQDLAVGVETPADPGSTKVSGVLFGSKSFPATLDVSAINGTNGFWITNTQATPGSIVAGEPGPLGDVSGDGIPDLAISFAKNTQSAVAVVFGSQEPWPVSFDISFIDGTNGFVVNNLAFGANIWTGIGDVNHDGIADFAVANFNGAPGNGKVSVIFGTKAGFPAQFNLSSLDGTNGFVINGGDYFASAIAGTGDINGDGIADFMIGSTPDTPTWQTFVLYGSATGFPAAMNVSAINGANGFVSIPPPTTVLP